MKIELRYMLLCLSNLICASLPPLFPSLLPRLHEAIARANIADIHSLIALTANPNELHLGRTALQAAVIYKNPEVIGLLLGYGVTLPDNIIEQLLRSCNDHYNIEQLIVSLKMLLAAGAHKGDLFAIPRGYLTPVMLAHADSDAIHAKVTKLIQYYGKQKIA
jgi:hypothetical protein